MTYLIERVQELRNKRTAWARSTKHALQAKLVEVANKSVRAGAKGKRVSPEVPLEGDDRRGEHTRPDEREGRFSARKTRVEESQTRNHDHDHGRSHENVGLITRTIPLVQVLRHW